MPLHFLSISDKLSAMKMIYPNLIAKFISGNTAIISACVFTDVVNDFLLGGGVDMAVYHTGGSGIDKNAKRANREVFEKMTAVFISRSALDI